MRTALFAALLACAFGARSAPAPLLIEAEVLPARVYVGGEARLRLRLLRAPGVPHGVLRPPALGAAAELSLAGPIRTYPIERSGILYEVLERTHVIVPRRAGRLLVPGAEFESQLRYAETFQPDARAAPAPLTAFGPAQVLEVLPVPGRAGAPWLPARSVTLEESWSRDPDALSTGTPVTRTLVLRAEGLAAERLPRLEMAAHPALRVHHDQPELSTEYLAEGMKAQRVQHIVLMPVGAAVVELPELKIHWWDVGADAPRVATLAARTLQLHAAIAPAALPAAAQPVSAPSVLRWVLAAIVALAALGFGWVVRTRGVREARRRLRAACRTGDARAARDALLAWSKAIGAPVVLVQRLGDAWDAKARAELLALDAALYAGGAWDGDAFWRAVRPWLRQRKGRRAAPPRAALPPFFRLQPPLTSAEAPGIRSPSVRSP